MGFPCLVILGTLQLVTMMHARLGTLFFCAHQVVMLAATMQNQTGLD